MKILIISADDVMLVGNATAFDIVLNAVLHALCNQFGHDTLFKKPLRKSQTITLIQLIESKKRRKDYKIYCTWEPYDNTRHMSWVIPYDFDVDMLLSTLCDSGINAYSVYDVICPKEFEKELIAHFEE